MVNTIILIPEKDLEGSANFFNNVNSHTKVNVPYPSTLGCLNVECGVYQQQATSANQKKQSKKNMQII